MKRSTIMKSQDPRTINNRQSLCSDRIKPILKWPGGKTQLLPAIRDHLPQSFGTYHEPCAGAASIFLYLRSQGYNGKAYLSDLNEELIRTYIAIKRVPETVIDVFRFHASYHSEEYYYILRDVGWKGMAAPAVAGRMLYLNHSCFNGLYRVNRKGQLNSSWGKRESISIDEKNLLSASKALGNVGLLQGDFGSVLDYASSDDFCYLDPPYPSGFTAYTSIRFDESDHQRLHNACLELNRKNIMFMQSNSDCPFIRKLYKDFHIVPVQARRNINCKGNGRGCVGEVIIMNY